MAAVVNRAEGALPALWLMRHARVLVAPGLCYGITEVEADPVATQEAAAQAARLLPQGMALRCSPARRCQDLALALHALRPDLMPSTDPRLAEMDFGAWEGRLWSDIGRDAMETWTGDFGETPPGLHGESVHRFLDRIGGAWDEWHQARRPELWITHAGVIRAVELLSQGRRRIAIAADWPSTPVEFGRCSPLAAP
ncbi:MAG: histidine phosphatase family protein [Pseudacidovorax sp.]|uniref:histidine phosphatase family protein n=1 Tax=Pseudacidovorax sp. TaxID=1934311 RepID=UPI001B6E32F2|nr:histidine phosphatase family protein [Pseudacidovorax sp.]MBP6894749.1 histidine phosphatase family protein [Pseudacidovorax sp.]